MEKLNTENPLTKGERLKLERKRLNLTQKQLAERLDFTEQQISNYEKDSRQPDDATLLKLANFFDVSTDYLLGNTHSRLTTNTDLSRNLGLSDNAIQKLSIFAQKNDWNADIYDDEITSFQNYSLIINKLIENENFDILIYFIRKYIYSIQKKKLKKEIFLNEFVNKDDSSEKNITNKDILQNCIEQGIYNELYEESSTDIYAYKINTLFNKIFESIVNQLEPSFSKKFTLNEDKTKIITVCNDKSENFKLINGFEGKSNSKKRGKNNGSSRNNKK